MSAPPDLSTWIRSARILVVDDQESWIRLVSAVLMSWGARIIGADSVARAEEILEQHDVDLVISDLMMPGEDGFHLIRWMRHHPNPRIRRKPVALMTSETSLLNVKRAQCCGADLVIEKPLKPDVLWLRMGGLIARGSSRERPVPPCAKLLTAPCPLIPVSPPAQADTGASAPTTPVKQSA